LKLDAAIGALGKLLLLAALTSGGALAEETGNPFIEELLLQPGLAIGDTAILAEETLLEIYRENGFNRYWSNSGNIRELLDLIEAAPEHGLNPGDYSISQLHALPQKLENSPSLREIAEAEILLTESLLRYGYHRRLGKVNARKLDPDINFRREGFGNQPPGKTLEEILKAPSLQGFIDMAAPSGPVYRRLQQGLQAYREIQAAGGWPAVSEGKTLRLGDSDRRVIEIRGRLSATGDLPNGAINSSLSFDESLERALMLFQKRHSLGADGIVGKQTIAAMNVSVSHRIDQLRASLERIRWVNQEAAETLVVVNIASYQVFFFERDALAWTTRAMVGNTYRKTPVFRGDIAYMEFNPTWTIPPTILRQDTLPAIKRDPGYLARKNIRVLDSNGRTVDPATVDWNKYTRGLPYTLRQDPGPENALGTVKFIFPNKHFVFLHDTPSRELFDRPERAFSSGCIRVEDPLKLAELLLNDPQQYSRSRLESIIASRRTQRINLEPKIPVVIMYLTAGLDGDGGLMFLKDIYDRDRKVLDALDGPVVIDLPDRVQP
jgi:murein L,D-transpeptidase YcbB/YkuD